MPHLSPFGVHSKIANSAFLPPGSQLLSPTKRLCRDNNNQHQGVNATATTWEAKTTSHKSIFFQELIIRHHIYVSKEKVKVFAHPPLKVTLESFITWSSTDCKEIKCNRNVDASAELMLWAGLFKAGLR